MAMLRIPELNVTSFPEVPQSDGRYPYFTMRPRLSGEVHAYSFIRIRSIPITSSLSSYQAAKGPAFSRTSRKASPSRLKSTQNGNFIDRGEISDIRGRFNANWK